MSKQPALFQWGPISPKQLKILTWWRTGSPVAENDIIVCDGSVRSGKTIAMSYSYVDWAFDTFNDQLFGISGKTIGSLRQNVVLPLKKILHGRGYEVDDKRQEKLLVVTKGKKRNTFELFGGKDESSQDLIQGRTLAGLLADEVVLQPESFINQGIARCSVPGSKIWFNCNPDGPHHWFKKQIINRIKKLHAFYLHFELNDNYTLTEKVKARYKQLYTGLFYKRFILGQWALAEGIIYDIWDRNRYMDTILNKTHFDNYIVGIDYGTSNPCTFGLYGFDNNEPPIYLIKEYWHDGSKTNAKQKTDYEYADDLSEFLEGYPEPDLIYVDPSALSFITELRQRQQYDIIAAKNEVLEGIRFIHTLLYHDNYYVDTSCEQTDTEYSSYIWDTNSQKKGKDMPLKQHDHTCDRDRYALYSHFYKQFYSSGQKYYK